MRKIILICALGFFLACNSLNNQYNNKLNEYNLRTQSDEIYWFLVVSLYNSNCVKCKDDIECYEKIDYRKIVLTNISLASSGNNESDTFYIDSTYLITYEYIVDKNSCKRIVDYYEGIQNIPETFKIEVKHRKILSYLDSDGFSHDFDINTASFKARERMFIKYLKSHNNITDKIRTLAKTKGYNI